MNIRSKLNFNSDKPATLAILKSENINYLAFGLLKGQKVKKHKASIPTILTVLQGKIEFLINDEHLVFKELDTYQIPVSIEHEVIGLENENIFTLMQEK